jgi:hypothetical protein
VMKLEAHRALLCVNRRFHPHAVSGPLDADLFLRLKTARNRERSY